jgi:phosphoglycolate phosphatase-like HAD superfamily hydrolase
VELAVLTDQADRALHVVWDWNGTLLDDFALTARIASVTLAELGVPGVTAQDVRSSFSRPFRTFYSRLLGRAVTEDEYAYIRRCYERDYDAEVFEMPLRTDAAHALDHLAPQATQSLLSMAPDAQLQALVDHHGLRHRFVRVDGSPTTNSDGNKASRLATHLAAMGIDGTQTVLIGDTVDDHEAAHACGAATVLVTCGSQSRTALEATGAPVAENLLQAAGTATAL